MHHARKCNLNAQALILLIGVSTLAKRNLIFIATDATILTFDAKGLIILRFLAALVCYPNTDRRRFVLTICVTRTDLI